MKGDPLVQIPVLSCSYSIGNLLTRLESPRVELFANTSIVITSTFNIFCETEGDNNTVIVAGAHLDSVPEGPGLNDNGSGSSSLLEIVLQWYALGLTPVNKIIFAWWGSEEVGLIGSRYYVKSLSDLSFLAMNLNFDMLASPNYVLGIHNGSTGVLKKNESYVITSMFIEYFDYMQVPYTLIDMTSGSDFVPFIEAGIPAGGLAAGASSIKTTEERTTFGGFANAQKDPCYHLYCDTVENINQECLGYMATAAAYVIQKSAQMPNLRGYLQTPVVKKSNSPRSEIYNSEDINL
jgi:Zn-dependent M28 family amino/carboxypeptidase